MISARPADGLLLCAALLGGACAPRVTEAPAVVPRGPILLVEADVRAAAELLRMEDSRVPDPGLLQRHAGSASAEIRGRAALAAGRVPGPASRDLLLEALGDADATVRARAAFALGRLPRPDSQVVAALTTVALRDATEPAAEAIASLGRLAAPGARAAIDSVLARPGRAPLVVHEALLAAWRLPRDPGTFDLLVRHTRSPDAELRWRAAYSLARTAGPAAVAPLLELVNDPDARVRANAVRGLRAPLADTAGARERALAAALAATADVHPHVRVNAINLLSAYRSPGRTTPALVQALSDVDANVAIAAAGALAQSADAAAAGALLATARGTTIDALRGAALQALMRADSTAGASLAGEWIGSERWLDRLYAARALPRADRAVAADLLHRLARDSHHVVAAEALSGLRALGDTAAATRGLHVELLAAPHPLVRAGAARGIGASATAADLDLLLHAYDRARRDDSREAALATIAALARVREAGVPVERSFFLRFGDAPPRDPVVHRAILDSIGQAPRAWPEPGPLFDVRPLDWYEGIVRTYVAPVLAGATPPSAVIETTAGRIALELAAADAPLTVHNFLSLIESGYYTGARWHRVVPNFVLQDGDPRGDGSGGPGYAIRDEINMLRYDRGTLGMALAGPDTGGGQYFITHSPQPHLDGGYTVFGRVLDGMEAADRVVQDDPITMIRAVR